MDQESRIRIQIRLTGAKNLHEWIVDVRATTTLPAGSAATASASFDGTAVRLSFGIPRGADGAPGEVSAADLAAAIAGTAANTNGVTTLDAPFSDPPTAAECEALRAKVNELILAQRR